MKKYGLIFLSTIFLSHFAFADQDQLNRYVAEEFQKIVARYQTRRNLLSSLGERNEKTCNTVLKLLTTGIWYPNDYFLELEKCAPHNPTVKSRLEYFIAKNLFVSSYADAGQGLKSVPMGFLAYILDTQSKIPPHEMIQKLGESGLIFLDCQTTIRLAWYRAILRLVDPKVFDNWIDRFEDGIVFSALRIDIDKLFDFDTSHKEMKPSYFYHLDNHLLYKRKEVNGEFGGFNVMAIDSGGKGEQRFIGFGLEPPEHKAPQGMTPPQITDILIRAFNDGPFFNQRTVSSELWEKILKPKENLGTLFLMLQDEKIKDLDDEDIYKRVAAKISKATGQTVSVGDVKSLIKDEKRHGFTGPFFLNYEKVMAALKGKI